MPAALRRVRHRLRRASALHARIDGVVMVTQSTSRSSIFTRLGGEPAQRAEYARRLADTLDRAGMQNKPQEILGGIAAVTALLWIVLAFVLRPGPIVGVLLLPLCAGAACGG